MNGLFLIPNFYQKIVFLGDNSNHDICGQGTIKVILDNKEVNTIENVLHV